MTRPAAGAAGFVISVECCWKTFTVVIPAKRSASRDDEGEVPG
ncbi:hypothetical protein [Pannonibacter phragmitetus]|nr:hypothetical protein [Pannonibacter phragmitetus]